MRPASKLSQLVHLWVELTRQLHRVMAPDARAQFGAHAGPLLVSGAVYLGTIEGRPMTSTKISEYVGIPRSTVIRQLGVLRRRGAVEKVGATYRIPTRRMERITRRDHGAIVRLVRITSERLSR
ncbi:helix-turn-helix domain-containing protein [Bradyrhizobium sp. PMVTL-01]|uniref:helix-turn-helix domain-containing protein n=1 Tax=Bradyrhizobium sp. PMVTL-01 TaxID=3434999 RepID=UPI003F71548E